jgi:multidrug efflux pump subunit AcrB/ABC-type multidrug transport system ATPase subunit
MNFIIKRKVLIAMVFIAVTLLGFFSYKQLPVELFPNAQFPLLFVQVSTGLEVDPKYMESQAVIPIEGAVGTLKGVEKIESTVSQRQASIQISFSQNTNIKYSYLRLLEKIDEVKKNLPSGFYVQVAKFDLEQYNNMLMTLQVRGGGGADRIRQITDRDILNKIQNVNGITNVSVYGGRTKSVEIILKEEVCQGYGISSANVKSALTNNSKTRTFTGKVTKNNQIYFVNVSSEYTDITELGDIIIKQNGSVRLKDIAEIRFGSKTPDSYSRVNGKETVSMQLSRDTQSNMIDLANKVKDQIEVINKELKSKDVEVVIEQNQAETMEKNLNEIINSAIIGALLAIFILWIFLKNIGLVVAIGLSIPISVYTAYNFFYAYGITINSLTLLGMALAIGMLVDNSVVVMENIYRLASQKTDTNTSVIQGTKEVWRSILASTLTTVMVFLPFAFSENFFVKLMGKHIGVSIISTLLISLFVAIILVPMITHTFLKIGERTKKVNFAVIQYHNRIIQIFIVLLKTCMRNPATTVISALLILFVTLFISLGISIFSSKETENTKLNLYVYTQSGTTLDKTDVIAANIEKRLSGLKEKKDIICKVYSEEALITIDLQKDFKKIRNYSVVAIKSEVEDRLKGVQATYSWEPMPQGTKFGGTDDGGFGGEGNDEFAQFLGLSTGPEKILVKGQDYDQLFAQADLVKYYLSQLPTINYAVVNVPSSRPELQLNFDKSTLALYNIPVSSVLSELSSFPREFNSDAIFKQGSQQYDIQIVTLTKKKEKDRDLNELKKLTVRNTDGAQFELQNISTFNMADGLTSIKRYNQEKQLTVQYKFIDEINADEDLLASAKLEVEGVLSAINLPAGITLDNVPANKGLADFKYLILASLILIFMIMASVFESFFTPFVMMLSIPLAAIGSMLALILTGNSLLSANTLIGFIILIGIVVNNGIILIDYSNILQKRGYRKERSLIMAGLARVRPILITAATTIIALIPMAMGKSEYVAEIGVPFAITVIGGLSLSTLLTLVYIPTFYMGLQSSLNWWKGQFTLSKIAQIVLIVIGIGLVYILVDSLVWQIIDWILTFVLVPASFYFVQTSLRLANTRLVAPDEPLRISVRNLVKIYDRDGKFAREWKSGLKTRERLGLAAEYKTLSDFRYLTWELPIAAFVGYLIYFHIENGFWYFLMPFVLYFLLISLVKPCISFTSYLKENNSRKWFHRILNFLYLLVFWGYPIVALLLFYKRYGQLGLIIPTALFWYLAILVKVTSDKIYREHVDIERVNGKFAGIRKGFYRFVKKIPLIGKKKVPFKALKGVSFEIENGMFGLLGPNGAGKSTLMRIICGILEPSYGQITINGFDIREKREELQGLIGYLPQEFGMYENLTAWEFLNYMAILKKINHCETREKRVEYVLSAVHMLEHKNEKIGSFSGGMKQRIGIAQILLHLPRILVVDEPTAGLDPRERIRFRNLLVELSKERIVIFSTHIIEDVASSCNWVAVIKNGETKYFGKPIDMAQIAQGKIWTVEMPIGEFEKFKDKYEIILHMRDGDNVRVRCLAQEQPAENAKLVKANLEDAYLCLLSDNS